VQRRATNANQPIKRPNLIVVSGATSPTHIRTGSIGLPCAIQICAPHCSR
jgi:hypothetical protein